MRIWSKAITSAALGAALWSATAMSVAAHVTEKRGHQHVTVTVNAKGYTPSTINVKAGQPVHLTFVSKGASCANGISIPALKKTINLQVGQKKEVIFTPKMGQTIGFACSMKMFKGKIVAK